MRVEDFNFASWLPNLLYPTEGLPFLDPERYRRTRAIGSFPELYMQKQGDFQPWGYFWGACSDFRRGDKESAHQLIHDGLQHVYGPGYFCEVGPCQWGGGTIPPYPTPHGAYLTAASEQLLLGSYWENEIGLFTNLPDAWRDRTIHFERLHSGTGVEATATYTQTSLTAVLKGQGRYRIRCRIPSLLDGQSVQIKIDGKTLLQQIEIHDDCEVRLTLELAGSQITLEIGPKTAG